MKQFPKMLYKDADTHITVESGDEEALARESGYVDFAELSVLEPPQVDLSTLTISERIAELESANHILIAENEGLHARISDYETRLQDAHQRATEQAQEVNSLDSVSAGTSDAAPSAQNSIDPYAGKTNADLRDLITAKGLTYKQRDGRDELIAILAAN